MVVDAHMHLPRTDGMKPELQALVRGHPAFSEWSGKLDSDRFLRFMDEEGIDQAWIVTYNAKDTMGYGREDAEAVWDFCAASDRLVALGGYDPNHDGPAEDALAYLGNRGVSLLKFHPVHQCLSPQDASLADFWSVAEGKMAVTVHTGPSVFPGACNQFADPALLVPILQAHPELQVILAHGGRPGDTLAAQSIVQAHPNAWMDLSGCPPARIPSYFPALESIQDRVLWGTDWPGPGVPSPSKNVAAFKALGYPASMQDAILHENAAKLLNSVQ